MFGHLSSQLTVYILTVRWSAWTEPGQFNLNQITHCFCHQRYYQLVEQSVGWFARFIWILWWIADDSWKRKFYYWTLELPV